MRRPYTDKQGQYLAFIYWYTKLHRQPPSEADMQRRFRVTPPSVHQMVLTLEANGLIERDSLGGPADSRPGAPGGVAGPGVGAFGRRLIPLSHALRSRKPVPRHSRLCLLPASGRGLAVAKASTAVPHRG